MLVLILPAFIGPNHLYLDFERSKQKFHGFTNLQSYEPLNIALIKKIIMLTVKILKVADVPTPKYAHDGDAGVDLYASESCVLKPMERKLVPTGIKLEIPIGYEGQVRPKSGLAINHGISFVNCIGTIDSGYRGEIKIPLINLGQDSFHIEKNSKIGQMVFAKVEHAQFEESRELGTTARQEGGFGSTGLK